MLVLSRKAAQTIRIGGGITVGTTGTSTTLDATGNNGEEGGEIVIRAGGSNVSLGTYATLKVTGAGSGSSAGRSVRVLCDDARIVFDLASRLG